MGMRVLACAPRGSVLCEGVHRTREGEETEDGGREVGLCNVCDYVGNYSHPPRLRSRRPYSPPLCLHPVGLAPTAEGL